MSRNILGDGILVVEDVRPHLLQTNSCHHHIQRWVNLPSCRVPPRTHYLQPEGQPVVEHVKGIPNPGGHKPGLRAE